MPPEGSHKSPGASTVQLDQRSRKLRRLVIRALAGGGRGHIGSTFSLIEILRVLYDDVLRVDPKLSDWELRDRFILSKGHGCLALYAVLADHGFFSPDILETFCRPGSSLGGHPEFGKVPGIEFSTGALGHGLPVGIGMALAARIKSRDTKVFVVVGDGEINEGSIWEAAMCAGKHHLDNLTVLIDYNKLQSYGLVDEVQPLEPLSDKWEAFGFAASEVDGHDISGLRDVLTNLPLKAGRPSAIVCHTIKGRGISFAEGQAEWHHKSNLSKEDTDRLLAELEAS